MSGQIHTWSQQKTTLQKEGFISTLYIPKEDAFPGKVLIMVNGSDGEFALTKLFARKYIQSGLTVLALAYWNEPGLLDAFRRVPLEIAAKAALWLKEKGYTKIGMWGVSKGSEYTLLCASYFPELLSCAVAVSPTCVCAQGLKVNTKKGKKLTLYDCSSFSYEGKDIPYTKIHRNWLRIILDCIIHRSLYLRSCYKGVLESAPPEAMIPLERAGGPVLLLAPQDDHIWPAFESCQILIKRLQDKNFSYDVGHYYYKYASHFLLPYHLQGKKIFPVERKYPEECRKSDLDSFEQTIRFLEKW